MSPGPLRRAFGPGYTLWSSMAAVALLALAILLLAATTPFVDQLLPGLPGATFRHAVAYERKPALLLETDLPSESLRGSLRSNGSYITTFGQNGVTNQIDSIINLIHVARLLDRIPVVPPFEPIHLPPGAGILKFGDMFDLGRFEATTGISILEQDDIKTRTGKSEAFGCWDIAPQSWVVEEFASDSTRARGLDVTLWPTDQAFQKGPNGGYAVESLVLQQMRNLTEHVAKLKGADQLANPNTRAEPPDDQILCYLNLFYLRLYGFVNGRYQVGHVGNRYGDRSISDFSESPAFVHYGRHLHFTRDVQEQAAQIRGVLLGSPTQPYIGIHLRRGDFVQLLRLSLHDAVANYRPLVAQAQQFAQARFGRSLPVLVATDEEDPALEAELAVDGWIHVNHTALQTSAKYGPYAPVILDNCLLGDAAAFVGQVGSTFSEFASARVIHWQNGKAWFV